MQGNRSEFARVVARADTQDRKRQEQIANQVTIINRLAERLDLWEEWAEREGVANAAREWIDRRLEERMADRARTEAEKTAAAEHSAAPAEPA